MIGDSSSSSRLAEDSDKAGVSSEHLNVVLDPGKSHHLVQLSHVARNIFQTEGEVAEGSQSVIDRDDDDAVDHPILRSEAVRRAVTRDKTSTVYPDHHGQGEVGLRDGDMNVEVKTVPGLQVCILKTFFVNFKLPQQEWEVVPRDLKTQNEKNADSASLLLP